MKTVCKITIKTLKVFRFSIPLKTNMQSYPYWGQRGLSEPPQKVLLLVPARWLLLILAHCHPLVCLSHRHGYWHPWREGEHQLMLHLQVTKQNVQSTVLQKIVYFPNLSSFSLRCSSLTKKKVKIYQKNHTKKLNIFKCIQHMKDDDLSKILSQDFFLNFSHCE